MLKVKLKSDTPEETNKEEYVPLSRGGTKVYSDPLFDAVKKFLVNDLKPRRYNIKFLQYNDGTKIVMYQGNPRNIWGMVEVVNWIDVEVEEGKTVSEPVYNIRIHSSILKNLLKKEETTAQYFKDVL